MIDIIIMITKAILIIICVIIIIVSLVTTTIVTFSCPQLFVAGKKACLQDLFVFQLTLIIQTNSNLKRMRACIKYKVMSKIDEIMIDSVKEKIIDSRD